MMSELRDMREELQEEEEEEEEEEIRPAFVVDDDTKAEWCIRKIREKNQELATWKDHYEKLFAAVEKKINEDLDYFNMQLEIYLRRQIEAGFAKKTKTQENYALPSGKLVLKKQEPEYERDNDKIIAWLKENKMTELVKVKEEPNWQELKKKLVYMDGHMATAEDGEIVPGIKATKRPDKFAVEVK